MNISKSRRQLTKNLVSLSVVQIANYAIPLISVPVISRIIGPEKYGVINFAAAFTAYFSLLITYGFDLTATRKIARDPDNAENRNQVFSEVFFTQSLLFVFAAVVFVLLINFVPHLRINKTVILFSAILCISNLFTQNWLFQAMQDLSKVAVFNLVSKLLFTVAILMVIREREDFIWQPLLYSTIQIVVSIAAFIWSIKAYKLRLRRVPLRRCFKLIIEERTVFFSLVVVSLYTNTNTFILGIFQNTEQVGYYTAGQRLILIAQSVLTIPLAQAFYPYIGKAFGEGREQGLQVARRLIPLIVIFVGSASLLMLVLGPLVIRIFYGQKFDQAIPVFQALSFIPVIIALSNVMGVQIMLNLNMDKTFLRITAIGAAVSIALNLIMVNRLGYMGTTVNWLLTEVFILVSMYITLRSKGINPVDMHYFRLASLAEHLDPIRRRWFVR